MPLQTVGAAGLTRRRLVAGALAGLSSMAAAPDGGALRDLMPEFWTAYDRARGSPDRPGALIDGFFAPHRDVYEGAGLKVDAARLSRWLPRFDAMAQDVRRVSAAFPNAYARHVEAFRAHFPTFAPAGAPVYAMPSLFGFDGHLQRWRGQIPLFMGLDGIVRYHGSDPKLSVLLDHESFHLLQNIGSPSLLAEPAPLWMTLWLEGGATYASGVLNPTASRTQVLLDDAELAALPRTAVPQLAKDFLSRFESTADADSERYFSASWRGETPARSGYLLGLCAFELIGRDLDVARLADRSADEAKTRLHRAVSTLAA